jgi:hypothetical protein
MTPLRFTISDLRQRVATAITVLRKTGLDFDPRDAGPHHLIVFVRDAGPEERGINRSLP